ncbi:BLUF domain-containing protein [Hymenobacter persicinus]|uniref:BLUF domain-containing protein n=1 Tax=Hymenobacter persicinus TaxID=2025506 RepID=A0A4Q5LFW2_9BACT|nr:BLUF domain-containing protein [Hymenobacter persicinus]RYU82425.1 BLUF domain-containing protein [Hymenobacter persicinus]
MSVAPLYHLVYQSTATTPFTEPELEALLRQSRAWNTAHDLTGVLLYSHGEIMQVLEGPEEEVTSIFRRIEQDYRHTGVVKLADGPIAQRNFSQWSMGFRAVNSREFEHLAGYQRPGQTEYFTSTADAGSDALHTVLATFVTEGEIRY